MTGRGIVLYAVGSPIALDLEETCLRLGRPVAAYVRNMEGPAYGSDPSKIVEAEECGALLAAHDVAVPLIGPAFRKRAVAEAVARGAARMPALVDPTAILPRSLTLAEGVYVNAGCLIGAATTIAEHCFLNRGVNLGHHVTLEPYVTLGPGVVTGGHVHIETGAFVGVGAVVLPEVRIGANAVVAAGAVVARDVPPNTLVAGNPARVAKTGVPGYRGAGV